jgi:two-component system chemotaxis sensor kinase CheA
MPDVTKDLIAIFKSETEEHLTRLENGLVEFEKQPQDTELVRSLNREVHTLKGAARVFGFHEIQDVAHRIEDVFEAIGGRQAVLNFMMTEKIFRGLDAIRSILERIVQEKEIDIDISDVCRGLEECLSATKGISAQEEQEEGLPSEKEVDTTPFRTTGTEESQGKTDEGVKTQDEVADRMSEKLPPRMAAPMEEYIRVPLSRVDKLLYLVGEVVVNKMKSSVMIAQTKRLSKLSKEMQKSISSLNEVVKKDFSAQYGEATKLLSQCDAQMQKLREHTLMLYDYVSTQGFHLDPVIDELQANMKKVKLLPLSTIFDGFPRMVRDIASQQGKEVNLVISGEETELDKKVLGGIKTSFIHILRNCVDHGIERPAERVAVGKQRVGTIKVSASHQADNVVITVEDDGIGMDIEEIKQTALKKRLVSNLDLAEKTEKEILNIVFMNGYSTSPEVTDVSGRGMGLDIVMRDITDLKGRVILDTKKHIGTKFTLVLPLTIAIIQALLVEVQNMVFALPMLPIIESVKVKMEDVATINGRMAIQFREHTVPLVRLNEVLEFPSPREEEDKKRREMLVVIATNLDRRVGFIVDKIVGEQEVFIKSLGRHIGKVKNVSGAVIMPSGEVMVVLDIASLIADSALSLSPSTGKRDAPKAKSKEKRILVVEDAFSTRELEKSILLTHGYVVDTAVDGLDALNRVIDTRYDLIVSDVEMPRMDGFELCRTLKEKEEYKEIPFVMVTALQKEEDKRRGIELGAAAYIVKSAFEQTNLLDTIQRLVG